MIDVPSALIGSGITLGIMLVGSFVSAMWSFRKRPYKPRPLPQPICGCSHHLSFHDDAKGCNFLVDKYHNRKCGCKKYIGPEHIPELLG